MRNNFNIPVWATVLYLFVITTRILGFWQEGRPVTAQVAETGNVILSIIGLTIAIVIVPQLLKKKKHAFRILKLSWPFVLVLMFSLMSCLWSEVPFIAFRRYFKVLIMVICVLTLFSENDFSASLKTAIFTYITLTTLISLVFILFFPQYGWHPYGESFLARGILGMKSEFSDFCAVSVLFVLWIKISSPGLEKLEEVALALIGVISILLLCLGQGLSSILNLCLALLFFLFNIIINRIYTNRTMAFLALGCSFISVFLLMSLLWVNGYIPTNLAEIAVTSMGKDLTFTGRVVMWEEILSITAKTHPFMGFGFGSFFVTEKSSLLSAELGWSYSAHNGYIKLFMEFGIVGTIIFGLFLGHLAISIFNLKNVGYKEKSALQALLIYVFGNNITSDTFLNPGIVFLILIVLSFYTAAINGHILGGNIPLGYFKRRTGGN